MRILRNVASTSIIMWENEGTSAAFPWFKTSSVIYGSGTDYRRRISPDIHDPGIGHCDSTTNGYPKAQGRQESAYSKIGLIFRKDVEQGDKSSEDQWVEEEHCVDGSLWAVGKDIVREEGVTGLWLGLKPGLVLTVNPAITYGVYERIKSIILLAQEKAATVSSSNPIKLTPGASFLVGALSKTLATVVTYPYIMAKVRIQAGEGVSEFVGVDETFV